MDKENKEKAKESLGFKSVPFYVVLNEHGDIVQKGGKKDVDFSFVPGVEVASEQKEDTNQIEGAELTERVFNMDEDF